ncbi:MAG: hypothetical protein ACLSGS_02490 [Adlercreutzia sp.]
MISIVYGLRKRFVASSYSHRAAHAAGRALCVHHRPGRAVTAGLAVAFLFAVLFDVVNVRNLLRPARRAPGSVPRCFYNAAARLQRAPSCYTESFRGSSKGDAG